MDRFPKTDRKKKADMTEWEKAQQGYLYDASYDQEIVDARTKCADLCYAFNACRPSDVKTQEKLIREMFGEIRGSFTITAPFYCDYGSNISIGDNFYTNHNCIILDGAKVTFGDSVFIAPNCVFLQQDTHWMPGCAQKAWKLHYPLQSETGYGSAQMYQYCPG